MNIWGNRADGEQPHRNHSASRAAVCLCVLLPSPARCSSISPLGRDQDVMQNSIGGRDKAHASALSAQSVAPALRLHLRRSSIRSSDTDAQMGRIRSARSPSRQSHAMPVLGSVGVWDGMPSKEVVVQDYGSVDTRPKIGVSRLSHSFPSQPERAWKMRNLSPSRPTSRPRRRVVVREMNPEMANRECDITIDKGGREHHVLGETATRQKGNGTFDASDLEGGANRPAVCHSPGKSLLEGPVKLR
jgi:hypothetical protein